MHEYHERGELNSCDVRFLTNLLTVTSCRALKIYGLLLIEEKRRRVVVGNENCHRLQILRLQPLPFPIAAADSLAASTFSHLFLLQPSLLAGAMRCSPASLPRRLCSAHGPRRSTTKQRGETRGEGSELRQAYPGAGRLRWWKRRDLHGRAPSACQVKWGHCSGFTKRKGGGSMSKKAPSRKLAGALLVAMSVSFPSFPFFHGIYSRG